MVLLHPTQLALLDRVHQYQQAGWISKSQANDLNRRVETEPVDELSRKLKEILRTATTKPTATQKKNNTSPPPVVSNQKQNDKAIIWNPAEWGKKFCSGVNDADQAMLDKLFSEMCFFARLGFYQPPCCLRCAYQKRPELSPVCEQWVVWRKDANKLLHPDTIGGNIVLLPCGSACRLLKGEEVNGWQWDAQEKVLEQEGCQVDRVLQSDACTGGQA